MWSWQLEIMNELIQRHIILFPGNCFFWHWKVTLGDIMFQSCNTKWFYHQSNLPHVTTLSLGTRALVIHESLLFIFSSLAVTRSVLCRYNWYVHALLCHTLLTRNNASQARDLCTLHFGDGSHLGTTAGCCRLVVIIIWHTCTCTCVHVHVYTCIHVNTAYSSEF